MNTRSTSQNGRWGRDPIGRWFVGGKLNLSCAHPFQKRREKNGFPLTPLKGEKVTKLAYSSPLWYNHLLI